MMANIVGAVMMAQAVQQCVLVQVEKVLVGSVEQELLMAKMVGAGTSYISAECGAGGIAL